jgi:hypothetical protein
METRLKTRGSTCLHPYRHWCYLSVHGRQTATWRGHPVRNLRHTTHLRDLPSRVRVIRPHHALEGKVLDVFAKVRHKDRPHFLLVLPDGSRTCVPVAWTDFVRDPASASPPCMIIGCALDLLVLRQRVDCLLRRIEADPAGTQNSTTQEIPHASATTGAVECRASSDSTGLSTAHAATTEPSGQSPGPTHFAVGASGSPFPSTLDRKQRP